MRRVYLLASLLVLAVGSLRADGTLALTCSLNVTGLPGAFSGFGSVGSNGCFSTSFSNVTTLDSLNLGASTTSSGEGVAVQVAPSDVMQTDSFAQQWSGSWAAPGNSWGSSLTYFAGHFSTTTTPAGQPPSTGSGTSATLLELPSGGPLELTFLGQSVSGVWFQIASLAGTNSLFVADVQAFDKDGNSLGTYTLTESGNYGSGGLCQSLAFSPAVPCNDAPHVGFYDPEGRIASVYVSVFDPNNSLTTPVGFAIGSVSVDHEIGPVPVAPVITSVQVVPVITSLSVAPATAVLQLDADDVPEPAMPLMICGGLAAMALYRRRRLAHVG